MFSLKVRCSEPTVRTADFKILPHSPQGPDEGFDEGGKEQIVHL